MNAKDNLLIPTFMNYQPVDCRIGTSNGIVTKGYMLDNCSVPISAESITSNCLTSWDHLMVVVEKIMELPHTTDNVNARLDLVNQLLTVHKKGVFSAVLEFIKWYNLK